MTYTDKDIAAAVEEVREFRKRDSWHKYVDGSWPPSRIATAFRVIAEAYIERLDQPAQETR